ncbi:Fe-S-cluster-containing dehydrogenase component [Halanaeroarchaeum sp. HSR-CO]|uniref:4Fe-4S ferredoxin N-terminal domain-containing protein n=1 Tax=Halanaeroarchaeum sp. HSR-CO TaxID=2866382 RepID=UPI00217D1854|nr:4Fe-4S ferredoxin N-terminal domain-containing protein [Halanaeroarchaeum sp. HSR-CO]UWG46404.1 Fe-S-cluster-containing dehydrogenase component [Halanaeroarchaeum sp. HSR-CO]
MPDEVTNEADGFPLSETAEPDREFDQELGRQMGEDAQKVADGEMTEAAFFEKYKEAVREEFGEDAHLAGQEVADE